METQAVTVARIYLREGEHMLPKIIRFLHDEEKVSGGTEYALTRYRCYWSRLYGR